MGHASEHVSAPCGRSAPPVGPRESFSHRPRLRRGAIETPARGCEAERDGPVTMGMSRRNATIHCSMARRSASAPARVKRRGSGTSDGPGPVEPFRRAFDARDGSRDPAQHGELRGRPGCTTGRGASFHGARRARPQGRARHSTRRPRGSVAHPGRATRVRHHQVAWGHGGLLVVLVLTDRATTNRSMLGRSTGVRLNGSRGRLCGRGVGDPVAPGADGGRVPGARGIARRGWPAGTSAVGVSGVRERWGPAAPGSVPPGRSIGEGMRSDAPSRGLCPRALTPPARGIN